MLRNLYFVTSILLVCTSVYANGFGAPNVFICNPDPHGDDVRILIPPPDFKLGVMLTVALNIRGEPSLRLSSVVSQHLLNPQIDPFSAYWNILNEYSFVEVSPELRELTNKTVVNTNIYDLQALINSTSCDEQPTGNVTVEQVRWTVLNLGYLFRSRGCLVLNVGCCTHCEHSTTAAVTETTSTEINNRVHIRRKEKALRGMKGQKMNFQDHKDRDTHLKSHVY